MLIRLGDGVEVGQVLLGGVLLITGEDEVVRFIGVALTGDQVQFRGQVIGKLTIDRVVFRLLAGILQIGVVRQQGGIGQWRIVGAVRTEIVIERENTRHGVQTFAVIKILQFLCPVEVAVVGEGAVDGQGTAVLIVPTGLLELAHRGDELELALVGEGPGGAQRSRPELGMVADLLFGIVGVRIDHATRLDARSQRRRITLVVKTFDRQQVRRIGGRREIQLAADTERIDRADIGVERLVEDQPLAVALDDSEAASELVLNERAAHAATQDRCLVITNADFPEGVEIIARRLGSDLDGASR